MNNWLIKNGKLKHPVIFLLILVVAFTSFSFYKFYSQTNAAPLFVDLSASVTDGVATVASGSTTTYTITASNAGPDSGNGAIVTNLAATGLSKTGLATCVGSGGASCTASFTATDLETGFAITTFPAGGSVTITFTADVTALSGNMVMNTASIASVSAVEMNPGNDSSTDTDAVTAPACPTITVSPASLPNGTVGVAYSQTVSAAGGTAPYSYAVTSGALPSGLSLNPGSGGITSTPTTAGIFNFTITATDNDGCTGSKVYSITVQAAFPVVSGTKTVTGSFIQGGAITYTIILTNTGGATQTDNPGDEFTDTFSVGLTGVTWSCVGAGGGSCTANGAGDINQSLVLPVGGSVTYTVNATISPTFNGIISNQGTINYDADNNGTNEASAVTDDTAVGGATDPTDFTVPDGIDLGAADIFAALGNSGVAGSIGAGTTVNGDVGSSPTASITNFPPSTVSSGFTLHATNDATVVQAHTDAVTAYNFLSALGPGTVLSSQLDGAVLTSGVYSFSGGAADLAALGTLTLNGSGVFVFNVDSSLTANVASSVIGTADACSIFWRVGTSATLNGTSFRGTVIADASITVGSGSNVTGRVLAGTGVTGQVTMAGAGSNTIGGCSTPVVTDIDCGLRAYDGSTTVTFACEPGTPTSAFRINNGGTDYGVILVDISDPDASAFRIETSSGTKALKAL